MIPIKMLKFYYCGNLSPNVQRKIQFLKLSTFILRGIYTRDHTIGYSPHNPGLWASFIQVFEYCA